MLTPTILDRQVPGAALLLLVELLCDNSYATGGYAYTPATFGLSAIDFIAPAGSNDGHVPVLDRANSKVKVFGQSAATGALVERANATNLSTTKLYVLVKGR